jgi:uncharacterized protein (DUF58 family)
MYLTRRGYATVAIVVAGVLMGAQYGARSLNAVVAPLVVALVATYLQLRRAEPPVVERTVPDDGFVGDTVPITLRVESENPTTGRVIDGTDPGLTATDNDVATTIGPSTELQYEVRIERRGRRTVGPAAITFTDVLGLAATTYEVSERDRFLAYPTVYDLAGATRYELDLLAEDALQHSREEFDRLREYDRGDSLRDVHWKSSAKRTDDDLIVKEFVADEDLGSLTIVAESTDAGGESMASAAASLALYFLDRGIDVGLVTPEGRLTEGAGGPHRLSILSLLALTDEGTAEGGASGDVRVYGHGNGATIHLDGREIPFGDLTTTEFGGERRPTIVSSVGDGTATLGVDA